MAKVTIVVREMGRSKPDYSLDFELPAVPTVGSYISINRPDTPQPYSEDLVVRHVWWRLHHPETRAMVTGDEKMKVGHLTEIFVECDQALGPYSSDAWRSGLERARANGFKVDEFDVERFSIKQSELPKPGG